MMNRQDTSIVHGADASIIERSWLEAFRKIDRNPATLYNRRLSDYINVLADAGFSVERKGKEIIDFIRLLKTITDKDICGTDEEYMELFENIWRDRAINNGWQFSIGFDHEDTILNFHDIGVPAK